MAETKEKNENDLIQELITKSEDEFEKKITYLGAGALLLSLTFLEKIIKLETSHCLWVLILGWILLTASLLINLISHLIAKIHLRRIQNEIEEKLNYDQRLKNHKRRVISIEGMNWSSVVALVIGILCIILFTSINAYKFSNTAIKINIKKEAQCVNIPTKNSKLCQRIIN